MKKETTGQKYNGLPYSIARGGHNKRPLKEPKILTLAVAGGKDQAAGPAATAHEHCHC